jgi:hydroxyacylglutathione hydrolase
MSGFQVEGITGGPFQTNAYLIVDEATRRCAIVDPGWGADRVFPPLLDQNHLELESIICTHGHIDHVSGVAALQRVYPDVPVLIHENDEAMLGQGNVAAGNFLGLPYEPAKPTGYLEEGKPVSVGGTTFNVIFVPGHCPGHVALFTDKTLISGDVIFADSIGRTDLPGGNYRELASSIVDKILPLGDEVTIYPGHGPTTTIGRERRSNPFVLQMLEGY